jgi:hypothetical protein
VAIGDLLGARVSPISDRTYEVRVETPIPSGRSRPNPKDDPIQLNSYGPFRDGDTLQVTFTGHAGGTAVFTVPGLGSDYAMQEIKPGVYQGQYTIRMGDIAVKEPVEITFQEKDGQTYKVMSSRTVIIRTAGGYLPRITYPRQGDTIASPIVIQGMAKPGAIVQVSIEYRRIIQGVLPLEGLTDITQVRADADGLWQTPPLVAASPFTDSEPELPFKLGIFSPWWAQDWSEPPIVYNISATVMTPDGGEQAQYSVDVTRKLGRDTEGTLPAQIEPKVRPTN